MSECSLVVERMPELLTEALAPVERELTHQHIEQCPSCEQEWLALREAWKTMGDVSDVPAPPQVRARFLDEVAAMTGDNNVVLFRPRHPIYRRFAQAAAVAVLVGGSFYAGHRATPAQPVRLQESPAVVNNVTPVSYSIAESRVVPSNQLSPEIQGRPRIQNVQFVKGEGGTPDGVAVSFDVTSHVTITGKRNDPSLVGLLSYVLQNQEHPSIGRSRAMEWVKDTYADGGATSPEIVRALANVLKNDSHEGVRIKAVETLQSLPATMAPEARAALIDALQNDPNPAVRIKAVDALAKLAKSNGSLDAAAVDMLRQKAAQDDENPYVRVKAAEALGQINFQ